MKEKFNQIDFKKTPETVKMKVGAHAGKRICDLPTRYLKYVAEHWNEDTEENKLICKLADEEYQHRKLNNLLEEDYP